MASNRPPVRRDPFSSGGTGDIDPELQAQLESRERRRAQARKAKRPKGTYDLPLKMLEALNNVAEDESVPRSDLVALALSDFFERYYRGDVSLDQLKTPTRSLRFDYKLQLPSKWR